MLVKSCSKSLYNLLPLQLWTSEVTRHSSLQCLGGTGYWSISNPVKKKVTAKNLSEGILLHSKKQVRKVARNILKSLLQHGPDCTWKTELLFCNDSLIHVST